MSEEAKANSTVLEVRPQAHLGFLRTFFLTVSSIRYRLFRSLITVGVISVAIAFLANILSESLIKRSVLDRTVQLVGHARQTAAWVSRLSVPDSVEHIVSVLAEEGAGGTELTAWIGLDADSSADLFRSAASAARFLSFIDRLDFHKRYRLARNLTGIGLLDYIADDAEWTRFRETYGSMRFRPDQPTVAGIDGVRSLWPELRETALRIRSAQARAISVVERSLSGRPVLEAFARAEPVFIRTVREAGFSLDDDTVRLLAVQSEHQLLVGELEEGMMAPEFRKAVAAYLDLQPGDVTVDTLWRLLGRKNSRDWYLRKTVEITGGPAPLTSVEAAALAQEHRQAMRLERVERLIGSDASGGFMGIGERMSWLLLVSFLLCAVGISNAMLMTVTERFREIAVMKCLGGLDGFIMLMFVLESCVLGFFGGVFGSFAGLVIAAGRMTANLGGLVWSSFPVLKLFAAAGLAVVLGILLAAVASLYPSFRAARLEPMEAMRIE